MSGGISNILIWMVNGLVQLLTIFMIVQVFVSYFIDPYNPFRQTLDRIAAPMLAPIRRYVPLVGNLDFSPLVFILIVQLIGTIIIRLLRIL